MVPAGVYKAAPDAKELNTAYVYARGKWGSPIMHLPGHAKVRAEWGLQEGQERWYHSVRTA